MRYLFYRDRGHAADQSLDSYVEIDQEGWECRRVEIFEDGRMIYTDGKTGSSECWLAPERMPPVDDIPAEFEPRDLSPDEFEEMWRRASI